MRGQCAARCVKTIGLRVNREHIQHAHSGKQNHQPLSRSCTKSAGTRPEQQRARRTLVHPRAARTEGAARRASAFLSARGKVSVPQGFQRQTRRICSAQNPAESAARPQNRQAPRRRSKARSFIHALRGLQKPRAKHRRSSHTRKYQHVRTAFIRQVFRNRRLICAARTIRKIGSASCPKATPLGDSECTDTAEPAAARPQNRKAPRP